MQIVHAQGPIPNEIAPTRCRNQEEHADGIACGLGPKDKSEMRDAKPTSDKMVLMLRAWLLFLAAFEVPSIYHCLSSSPEDGQLFDGFASNLKPGV